MEGNERNFSIASYQKAVDGMIRTNNRNYSEWSRQGWQITKAYTQEEIQKIIEHGSFVEQQRLSRNFFNVDGFYRQTMVFLATLLKYTGILIPSPAYGKDLKTAHIQKKYYNAIDFVSKINFSSFFTECALRALVDGCYYGIVQRLDKNTFSVINLPYAYCASNFKDEQGRDVIEFNVSYFRTITDEDERERTLAAYPEEVSTAYNLWSTGKRSSPWVYVSTEVGICFPFFEGNPVLLNIIPATLKYGEALENELVKGKEEIRKIIVQEIPHLSDGRLLFEPEEAEEIHRGAVEMMRGDPNISVITSYGSVSSISAKTTADNINSALDGFLNNIYAQAGVSRQIFASDSIAGLEASLNSCTALMMYLANKFANFMTHLINRLYGNSNITFKYTILPVTYYNQDDFIKSSLNMANSGFSYIIPAVAMGITQKDLCDLRDLELEVLKLDERLKPLSTAFTQSANADNNAASQNPNKGEGAGRPALDPSERSEKTTANRESLERQ